MINIEALGKLKKFRGIRQKQVILPVSKIRAVTSPLTVRDDLSLKTMIVSPDVYDKTLSELLYEHTELLDVTLPTGEVHSFSGTKINFEQFQNMISNFDRRSLIWGIYAATYETFGEVEVKCPGCKETWKDSITAEQVVSHDSFSIWDEEKTFLDYVFPVEIVLEGSEETGIQKFVFNTFIPNIKEHLNVLRLVSTEKMRETLEKFNKVISQSEELALITKSIDIVPIDPKEKVTSVEGLLDIYKTISDYIPLNIMVTVSEAYDEKFKKYIPSFKKKYECSQCNNQFDYPIDIEVALFRSFLRL